MMDLLERSVREMLNLVSEGENRMNESLMVWSQHLLEQLGKLRGDLGESDIGRRHAQARR